MESDPSEIKSGRNSGEARDPVVRRKDLAGKSRLGRAGARVDKVASPEQKKDIVQENGVPGRGTRGEVGNGRIREIKPKTDVSKFNKSRGEEKQDGDVRKNGNTEVKKEINPRVIKEKKHEVGARRGAGDGQVFKGEEEKKNGLFKRRSSAARKEIQGEKVIQKKTLRTVEDYLKLLKLLKINLPQGVLNVKVIKNSTDSNVIQDAQAIIQDLEDFKLRFAANPRLGCREVKHALNLKKKDKPQEITRIVFFEKTKDTVEALKKNWEENVSNTSHQFRMRDRYRTKPVSTPAMYATRETRSWGHLKPGTGLPTITKGVRVNVQELGKTELSNEHQNSVSEKKCLKFFHELREIKSNYNKLTYTKGNKVEFGFLTGNLDFLVEATLNSAKNKESSTSHEIIIECKRTTGDMVDKLFTKRLTGSGKAELKKTHEYCYQTQAYMYMLKQMKQTSAAVRAVMVVRHYHSDSRSDDFYWNYLKEDHTNQIDKLRVYCQEEVLARFLAVLNLIFQKDTDIL